jgi:hypothetical protein
MGIAFETGNPKAAKSRLAALPQASVQGDLARWQRQEPAPLK